MKGESIEEKGKLELFKLCKEYLSKNGKERQTWEKERAEKRGKEVALWGLVRQASKLIMRCSIYNYNINYIPVTFVDLQSYKQGGHKY